MAKWSRIRENLLSDPTVREEYDNLSPVDIAAQIIKARKEKNMTQEELAGLAGTKQPAISRIESGYDKYSIKTLSRIAHALGMEIQIRLVKRGVRS